MRPTVSPPVPELRTESRSNPVTSPSAAPFSSSRFRGKHVHFIGIAGCGMAGLARILLDSGAIVSGSDPSPTEQTFEMVRRGVKISRTQMGELISRDIDLVVRTAAVPDNNPEFLAARKHHLPVIKYAQLLGQIMQERLGIAVSGTHGKSTTSAMIAHALMQCGADPSFVIGGTVPQLGGSSHSGTGNAFVVEACEYDRSFHSLHPTAAIITNIEKDHLDCYKDLDDIIASFHHFAALTPCEGIILANGQDQNVARALAGIQARVERIGIRGGTGVPPVKKEKIVPLDWETHQLPPINGCYRGIVQYRGTDVAALALSVPGDHNLFNATVALAACHLVGVELKQAAAALGTFRGVDRRMTRVGQYNGATIVDDYGHHPTEIATTLKAAKEAYRPTRLYCVFQPHQHSRTRTLLDEFATCFADATHVLVPDIYSVRDSDEEKRLTTSRTLVDRVVAAGSNATYLPKFAQVVEYLKQNAASGDLILTMGAGNVCDIARQLAGAGG
jgi:UDP-N-acetylmuramate--alanine ligase